VDFYTTERWILDRHEAMIRTAELRSRLAGPEPKPWLSRWLAVNLRRAADRLDEQPRLEPTAR
jgi:hypothetical protein